MPSAETFVLNRHNQPLLEGRRGFSLTLHGVSLGCAALFMLPFVIAGLVTLALAGYQWYRVAAFATVSVQTEATITDKLISSGEDGDSRYLVVRYEALAGRESAFYSGVVAVGSAEYAAATAGDAVRVRYLPHAPQEVQLASVGWGDLGLPIFLTFFTLFWNGFIGLAFPHTLRRMLRGYRLQRRGTLVQGAVTGFSSRVDSDDDLVVTLNYSFSAPDGRPISGVATGVRNDLKGAPPVAAGTPVTLLYLDPQLYELL